MLFSFKHLKFLQRGNCNKYKLADLKRLHACSLIEHIPDGFYDKATNVLYQPFTK